ncbi:MAG TPA: hypothetical protein PKB08_12270, partial [Burkholderiaceae bacterium]|nr:hypothetical protein [Burkholderiaceae bacterium]
WERSAHRFVHRNNPDFRASPAEVKNFLVRRNNSFRCPAAAGHNSLIQREKIHRHEQSAR